MQLWWWRWRVEHSLSGGEEGWGPMLYIYKGYSWGGSGAIYEPPPRVEGKSQLTHWMCAGWGLRT